MTERKMLKFYEAVCLGLSSFTAVALDRHESAPRRCLSMFEGSFWISWVIFGCHKWTQVLLAWSKKKKKKSVLLSILHCTGQALPWRIVWLTLSIKKALRKTCFAECRSSITKMFHIVDSESFMIQYCSNI